MKSARDMIISEAITHLEDLDIQAFISAVKNIANFIASEKLDGANLQFGIDSQGRLYTSRAGKTKSAESMYSEASYPYLSANNGFRSAHAALAAKEADIKSILEPGDAVEIEILFGRQPNAVTYGAGGKNYIAFIRGVGKTSDAVVDKLSAALANQVVSVDVKVVDTSDGENLVIQPANLSFQFVGVQKIDSTKLKDINLTKELGQLDAFLNQASGVEGATNFDIISRALTSFDKEVRPQVKELRSKLQAKLMTDFKLPIKKELLTKFVNQIKSPLAASDISPDEDIGIEGVVLREPTTGDQIKLVDKDTFTTINQFNHAVRASISGMVKTTDSDASVESRGGLIGELKIMIADLLGNKDLARTQGAKKVLSGVKGATPEETVKNLAKELGGGDDLRALQRKINALIEETLRKLGNSLKEFKTNKDNFKLKLKSGKQIGLSPEIIRRTLVVFAESKRDLLELAEKVKKAKTKAQLAAVLYGKQAKAVHQDTDEQITEAVLNETRLFTDKAQYQNKDGWTLLNIYFATVMMAAVIYKAEDKLGIRMLKDKTHCRLSAWSKEMSALNFWGYVIWRVSSPAVKKLIGKKVAAELFRHVRKVPANWWRWLHIDLSYGKDTKIDWNDHLKALKVLQHFPGMNVDRINNLLDSTFRYEELTFDEKIKFLNKLYYYVNQFIPTTPLLTRIRAINNNLLFNAGGENYQMVQEMKLLRSVVALSEDGEATAGATTAGGGVGGATTAAAISPIETKLMSGKLIRRVQRKKWQAPKFQNPNKDTAK